MKKLQKSEIFGGVVPGMENLEMRPQVLSKPDEVVLRIG